MSETWEIAFTQQFESDVKRLKKSGNDNWLDGLAFLKMGPKSDNTQSKKLKNYSKAFRWRKGHLRVIFRVIENTKSILLLVADHRKSIYKRKLSLNQDPAGKFDELVDKTNSKNMLVPLDGSKEQSQDTFSFDVHNDGSILEEMFLDEADLFLINIPEIYHPALLDAESMNDIDSLPVPDHIRQRIEAYITAPQIHHVGRIYSLERADSLESIANQSLDNFLVSLDPQQKSIVERSFTGGPWLIRGGPGTGKTLINLARIRRICDERIGKDLLHTGPVRIGFVTYNRPLSRSAETMFQAITKAKGHEFVKFSTLDQLVNKLIKKVGRTPSRIIEDKDTKRIVDSIFIKFKSNTYDLTYIQKFRQRRGNNFFIEEFDQTILGCGLHKLEDYLEYPRKGRKVGLQSKERGLVHMIYRLWLEQLRLQRGSTFSSKRLALLNHIESGRLNLDSEKFDFLFVDELQDLSVVAIRVLAKLVKYPENLTFSADTAQSIYLKSPSWSNISDKIRFHAGNSFILKKSYRMTKQIDRAISPLRLSSGDSDKESDGIDQAIFDGTKPIWLDSPIGDHPRTAARLAKTLMQRGINLGQIAVITPDKRTTDLVSAEFKKLELSVDLVAENKMIDIYSNAVHLLHVHISKGLEFPFVIVVGVVEGSYPNSFAMQEARDSDEKQEELDKSRRLLYVALSRAARGLYMLSDPVIPSPLLAFLRHEDWDKPTDTKEP